MLSIQDFESILRRVEPQLRDIVFELRNIVAEVAPGVAERIHSKGLSYFIESRGGTVSAAVCQIVIEKDHIRIVSFEHAPWDYLKEMITTSSRFGPREPGAASKTDKPPVK